MMFSCSPKLILAAVVIFTGSSGPAAEPATPGVSGGVALRRLEQGNARFVSGRVKSISPDAVAESRREVAQGQKPFAIIVGCSDSRVGPEVIFDQKVGDIFVVRTAGEVVDPVGLGSIEYGVAHLGAGLIMVLGHERCGAVAAAVANAREPGHIGAVLKAIKPAVRQTKSQPGDPVDNAVRANALDIARRLQTTGPILKQAVESGKLRIVAARYDLDSGKVTLLREAKK
ncbi:MAG: carbonic anhydrase [Chthoniobacteraceae bacterium]